jgi:predicted RNA-binding protein with PUA-like domain
MPNHWLLKTEPGTFSWQDLVRDGRATWDGVKNPAALGHLRAMRPGDLAFFYHTGGDKSVVGICRVVSEPYADPKAGDPRLVVRIPRLSVMPVTPDQWQAIQEMA